jgi:hypothetical protein
MKPIEININTFAGGISDDVRKSSASEFTISQHFDIFSYPNRLVPYRSLEADTETSVSETDLKQYFIRDFLYASESAKLYGLGQTGAGNTKIVFKADAISGLWTLPSSSEGDSAVKNGCFVEYKDYLWGFQGNNKIFRWGLLSGTPSITNSVATVGSTITSVANGVIASDANLYLAYNNVVVRVNTSLTVTDSAKTVPSNYKITSLANFGNYLAIGCSPVSNFNGVSKVFIWNLSSDLFQETVDWGEGELRVLETVEGYLVGVTDRYLNSTAGAGKGSMVIQMWSGGVPQVIKEVFTETLNGKSIPLSKALKNNRLFWSAKIMTNSAGTEYVEGLWSFGRKNINYPFTLTLDIIDENINTSGIQAFGTASNFFFIAHSNDGSIDKTDDEENYDFTSIYESQIINFNTLDEKRLDKIKVSFAPIESGQELTVKMKVDGDTAWTTVGTYDTVGKVSYTFRGIGNVNFPSGREYKFRLESDGGLEITGYSLQATPLNQP